jgi:hypothetical protein
VEEGITGIGRKIDVLGAKGKRVDWCSGMKEGRTEIASITWLEICYQGARSSCPHKVNNLFTTTTARGKGITPKHPTTKHGQGCFTKPKTPWSRVVNTKYR